MKKIDSIKVSPYVAASVLMFLLLTCFAVSAISEPKFVTLKSEPGKLEIVREPSRVYFTRFSGRGRIDSVPEYDPTVYKYRPVDLRSCYLSLLNLENRLEDLLQADFDSRTTWPAKLPTGFDPELIMEVGKNPGLRLRSLHKRGITGAGVGIAILDQTLLVNHCEYRDRLRLYEEIHNPENAKVSMHGVATASIALGTNVGVAPNADLYFIANWHANRVGEKWEQDVSIIAEAIDRIVEINTMLPSDRSIRIISISLGINPAMDGYEGVMLSIEKASEAGIYTIYVGSEPFAGLGREPYKDPNAFESYSPGQFWKSNRRWAVSEQPDIVMVPMDSRCTAAPNGPSDYVFYRSNGMSWTVPWIAGLYALACQVRPGITPEVFWDAARKTSRVARAMLDGRFQEFGRIIDPTALIEAIR